MSSNLTSWYELIGQELESQGETWADVVSNTLSDKELHSQFDCGHGSTNGWSFTLWTRKRVYFPVTYDGAEWAASVSRDPDGVATAHVGGG